jgi:hypothetical protein
VVKLPWLAADAYRPATPWPAQCPVPPYVTTAGEQPRPKAGAGPRRQTHGPRPRPKRAASVRRTSRADRPRAVLFAARCLGEDLQEPALFRAAAAAGERSSGLSSTRRQYMPPRGRLAAQRHARLGCPRRPSAQPPCNQPDPGGQHATATMRRSGKRNGHVVAAAQTLHLAEDFHMTTGDA